jgi:hypothetical protein
MIHDHMTMVVIFMGINHKCPWTFVVHGHGLHYASMTYCKTKSKLDELKNPENFFFSFFFFFLFPPFSKGLASKQEKKLLVCTTPYKHKTLAGVFFSPVGLP